MAGFHQHPYQGDSFAAGLSLTQRRIEPVSDLKKNMSGSSLVEPGQGCRGLNVSLHSQRRSGKVSRSSLRVRAKEMIDAKNEMDGQMKHSGIIKACILAVLSSMAFASCNEDEFIEKGGSGKRYDYVCFGVFSDTEMPTKGSRHKSGKYDAGNFVLRSRNSRDTLCASVTVSDGIKFSQAMTEKRLAGAVGRKRLAKSVPVNAESFYDRFHVLAYRYHTESGAPTSSFFMDADASKSGEVWKTDTVYYWPGAQHSFRFFAWAPSNPAGLTTRPTNTGSTTLGYTVPDTATWQQDVVVAATGQIPGDRNASVPLQFKHICTAVRFVVGSQMQCAQIESIKLKDVKFRGSYDMAGGTWSLAAETKDFSQTVSMLVEGDEAEGDEITTSEGTFMMLPQVLTNSAAKLEVTFRDCNNARKVVEKALTGEWPMGKTVTYKLTVTPEYDLDFSQTPALYQDAHYVVCKLKVRAGNNVPGGWTLTSNDPTNVTFVKEGDFIADIKSLVDAGYWLDGYNGSGTTSGTAGETTVYVFLKENATTSDRNITLSLKPRTGPCSGREFSFIQYCPSWNGNLGTERIQDRDYPWGFNWDANMKVVYSMPSGLFAGLLHLFQLNWLGNHAYLQSSGTAWGGTWKITVDFSKVPPITTAVSESDGKTNTWEIYNFDGVNDAEVAMKQLESWGGVPDRELPANPSEFAARACAMKNKYTVDIQTDSDGTNYYKPVLNQEDMVWYLPAQNEALSMSGGLSGNYWTSTAITSPGTTSYKYTAGGTTSAQDRNSVLHVRAVRRR